MAMGDPDALAMLAREAVQRFGLIRGRGPGEQRWSSYNVMNRVSPDELVDKALAGLLGADTGDGPVDAAAGRGAGARVRGAGRHGGTTPRGRGPRPGARRPPHRPPGDRAGRLHLGPQGRPRADAPRDPAARAAARDPGQPRAALAPRPAARLPPYRARLDVQRRRADGDPPQAEAARAHRPRGALRRQRLGRQLRELHADAGLRAARAVQPGARVHLRRRDPRGHRPLHTRGRPRADDGRPRGERALRHACGAAPTTAARSPASPRSTPTR